MNKNALQAAIMLHNKTTRAMRSANAGQKAQIAMEIARMNEKLLRALAEVVGVMEILQTDDIAVLQALGIQGGAMAGFIRKVNTGIDGGCIVAGNALQEEWETFKNELAVLMKTIEAMQPHHDKIAAALNDNETDTSEHVHKTGGMTDEGTTNG